MSHGARTFTAEEILQFLDENYDIPGDGEHSELDSDDENLLVEEVAISDDEGSENEENPDDIRSFDVIEESSIDSEVDETADPAVRRGRLLQFDFSSVSWVEDSDMPTQGKFHQEISTVLPKDATAKTFFQLFFMRVILMNILRETTKYAHQQLQAQGKDTNVWQPVTEEEFMAWLGFLLAMGFHRLPSIRDYWSTDWVLGTQELVKVMPQRRFEEILRYFHVNDNTNMPQRGSPEFDKLYKISPFINEIKTNFLMQYHPNEHQAIDEAMIKFKGCSSLIQYMPKKSTKRGIKMWCRADSGNGYLCDFDIYVGRTSDGIEHDLAFSVVTKLCQTLYGKWHKVFLDNFFTTLKLVEHLFENKVLSCGTFRSGRKGFPKELFDKKEIKKLQRGEVMWRRKGPIVALTWLDNKPVHVLSTFSKPPEEGGKQPVK